MMNRIIELAVHRVENQGDNIATADVRICRGPIHLGDKLFVTYGRSKEYKNGKWLDADPNPIYEVNLEVVEIEAYGRKFEELDEGITARVTVSGKGIEHLSKCPLVGNERTAV